MPPDPSPPARLPPPAAALGVPARVVGLAGLLGTAAVVDVCVDLLGGAPREDHLDALPWLTNQAWEEGAPVRDHTRWKDFWVRHWGARGLLHVWDDAATLAVLAGLADGHWRPAETCLRVVARHEVAGAGSPVADLAVHDVPRVRAQVARALAVVGDTEHAATLAALSEDPEDAVRRAAQRAWPVLVARLDLPPQASIELMSP